MAAAAANFVTVGVVSAAIRSSNLTQRSAEQSTPQLCLPSCSHGVRSNWVSRYRSKIEATGRRAQVSASTTESNLPRNSVRQGQGPKESVLRRSTNLRRSTKAEQSQRRLQCRAQTYTVEILHQGESHVLQVPEDDTILSVALEQGLDVSYDCKLGVCMTCPAKLEKGIVDQSEGMLSEDVIERGYALMCVSYPLSDCTIRTIPEEELLSLQLATANDA